MAFIFLFAGRAFQARARALERALAQNGIEVCRGLSNEPEEVRSSVASTLVDHCALMVALTSEGDLADAAFVETLSYAQSREKLFAVGAAGVRFPASLGALHPAPENWSRALDDLVQAIAEHGKVERQSSNGGAKPLQSAREEYAALARMHARGSADAKVRFLRAFAGGMFEDIVRAELDALTRPTYEPGASRPWMVESGSETERATRAVWRTGVLDLADLWSRISSPNPARLAAAAGAGLVAIAALAIAYAPLRDASESSRISQPRAEAAQVDGLLTEVAPKRAAAAPAPTESPSLAASDSIDSAVRRDPPIDARPIALTAPPEPTAALEAEPQAFDPFDVSVLSPDIAALVRRARQNEAAALALALGRGGQANAASVPARAGSNAGVYRGQWANGAAQGLGRAVWPNGDTYAGAWSQSVPNGLGVLSLAGGARYEGEFIAGAPSRRSVFWSADGRVISADRTEGFFPSNR